LASCSIGLPLAPLFLVASTVFRVSGRPEPSGCGGSCSTTVLREDAHGRLMKTSTLLMHLYQYKYQFLVPLLALVLVNSTIR
jgi:hypothetical protein